MSSLSKIEWTESTWNPTRGCSPISPGCANCYAARFARRLGGAGKPYEGLTHATHKGIQWTGDIRLVEEALETPLRWRKRRLVFVDSMSDLFHEGVPLDFIQRVFETMCQASWHTFQVLTKRATRLRQLYRELPWPENIWVGVSVESQEFVTRADELRLVPARTRFLSLEPLTGEIRELNLEGIHWVIVGGESGPGARRMHVSWVRWIRDLCTEQDVPFFFKQWGGIQKSRNGRELDGRFWDGMPIAPILARAGCYSCGHRETDHDHKALL